MNYERPRWFNAVAGKRLEKTNVSNRSTKKKHVCGSQRELRQPFNWSNTLEQLDSPGEKNVTFSIWHTFRGYSPLIIECHKNIHNALHTMQKFLNFFITYRTNEIGKSRDDMPNPPYYITFTTVFFFTHFYAHACKTFIAFFHASWIPKIEIHTTIEITWH